MCLCFRASSAALRPAGLRWFKGDKDSVTAVGSSAYGQAGKVVGSAVEFARFLRDGLGHAVTPRASAHGPPRALFSVRP